MTEKRFELNDMGNGVEDIFNGEKFNIYGCCDKMNEQELRIDKLENQVIVLNKKQNKTLVAQIKELENENEQFKNLARDYNIPFDKLCETFESCLDENEQLKSEINMLKVTIGRNEAHIKRLTEKSNWRTSAYD